MSVSRICTRDVQVIEAEATARAAARRMLERGVGALVVTDAERRPVGLLTDRDLTLRALAAGRDPDTTTVEQVMTAHPRTFPEDTPVERALWLMRAWGVRRVPVVDRDGRLAGVLALDDVVALIAGELHVAAQVLEKQVPPGLDAMDVAG